MKIHSWLVLIAILPHSLWADQNTPPVGSTSAVIGQTLLGLLIVVAAIYSLAWVTKKISGHTPKGPHGLKLLACLPLGPKEKAVLVEAGGKKMLLGVTPGSVNTLHVYEGEERDEAEKLFIPADEAEPDDSGMLSRLAARSSSEFSRKLNAFLGQGNRTQ